LLEGLCIREPPTHLVSWFSDALLAQYKNLEMNSEDQPRRLKVGTFYPLKLQHRGRAPLFSSVLSIASLFIESSWISTDGSVGRAA
jgi:hypothetical protein